MEISVIAAQGLMRAQDELDTAARRIARDGPTADTAVDLLSAKNEFAANIQLLKISGEMHGKLLNLLA